MENSTQLKKLDFILSELMRRYQERVPDVSIICNALEKQKSVDSAESVIKNDHIAFRAMGVPNLGIASMEKIFLHYGYEKKEYLNFPEKKLNAYWYHPPLPHYPRVFISELRVHELSEKAQEIIHKYTKDITVDPIENINLDDEKSVDSFLHSGLWAIPSIEDYNILQQETEYGSWVIYNRYYLNHFTISVHDLPQFENLEAFNQWLETLGIKLNDAGGKIKVSPDGLLRQSSTVAQMIEATFLGNQTKMIPGSYVEFAERLVLPEFAHLPKNEIKREHRRDGFEAKNADKIFESTFSSQTNK
ncbi:MAG: DUF1338 domain-containing protein [Sphingobacteriaceae bacterium]|nr:DUF1338 domain-containing protein [Sphingobacteriaceae bacterium]